MRRRQDRTIRTFAAVVALAAVPDTTERAYAPDITYPFFTDIWMER